MNNRYKQVELEKRNNFRKLKKRIIAASIAVLLLIPSIYFGVAAYKNINSYNIAVNYIKAKDYDKGIALLRDLDDYKDSKELILKASYEQAQGYFEDGDYEKSYQEYKNLGDYLDSQEMKAESLYQNGMKLFDNSNISNALEIFKQLEDYKESEARLTECEKILAEGETKINENNVTSILDTDSNTKVNVDTSNSTVNIEKNIVAQTREEEVSSFISFISGTWTRPYDAGMPDSSGVITFIKVDGSHLNCYDDGSSSWGDIQNALVKKISGMGNTYYFEKRIDGGKTTNENGDTIDYYLIVSYEITKVDENTIFINLYILAYRNDGTYYQVGGTKYTYHR